ncbi:Uncharacterized protein YR821_0836 [Yersinia ruckeri]|uniref:Uncharacterized protein n=1 Tax=Yersinia ruckeri TaxID=29486 RepID=A0A0A8VFB0_YERRU|nr:hypothetical protein yruck0001_23190 [Yersinia ruckeri ATCC 29473]QTD75767.1 Uncharacterized protein YR821_0836 [Yersinia ruckeri]CEK26664.1 hypothetical protein CSF007_4480 [Yersinia ruckeri]
MIQIIWRVFLNNPQVQLVLTNYLVDDSAFPIQTCLSPL